MSNGNSDSKGQDAAAAAAAAAFTQVARETARQDLDLDPRPFAALVNNEAELRRVFLAIEDAIYRSVGVDIQRSPLIHVGQRSMTRAELKYRFKVCESWIRRARGDLGLSVEKTLDLMHHALRSELDGNPFDPATLQTRIWSPT